MPNTLEQISPISSTREALLEDSLQRLKSAQIQEENALSQIFRLLNSLSNIMHETKRDFIDVVRADIKHYQEESDDLSRERNFQGWSVATLTLAGTMALGLSTLVSEISELSPHAQDLIDTLGGVESVENLCKASGQLSEGVKPVANVWSEARVTTKETNRQFLQLAYQRGQQAADQGNATVEKLVNAALRLYDVDSRSRA